MLEIRTVLGSILPERMGFTDLHVHLITDCGLVLQQFPALRLDSVEKACKEVELFMQAGGQGMIEFAPLGWGRNPRKLVEVAKRTGLNLVGCTGLHKNTYYLDSHWRNRYSPEQMAQIFAEEIELGMDANGYEGPFIDRTEARAGVIKIATEYECISPLDEKIIRAASLAHLQTGAPIVTHTEKGTMGLEQVKLLMSHGVDPHHIILSHLDHNPDFFEHRRIAELGVFLIYDTSVRRKHWQRCYVLGLYRQMINAGYGL